jgi:hypothetical protein
MNRFIATLANVAVLCLGIALSGTAGAQTVQNHNLLPGQEAPRNIPSAQPTRGVVFLTATINSNGSIAACFGCNAAKTLRLAPGAYQVDFGQNVQAINGWSRWVQADTLTTGSENAYCNTADRAGDNNAIFVNCQQSSGPVDVSFFLFAAR